jgi:hypothetical protein
MSKKIALALILAAASVSTAQANGYRQSSPSLLGALVSVGNHGSVANVGAAVGNHNSVADIRVNALGGAVKADVNVGQQNRHSSTLLGIGVNVLDGGVGNRRW